jgi:hypothetical protein
MQFLRIATALCLVTFFGARAQAGPTSPLLEGEFDFASAEDLSHNVCTMLVDGGGFVADGGVNSVDDAFQSVSINYSTAQPTSITRSSDKLAIKQSEFATLSVTVGAATPFTNLPIEKCSVTSSFSKSKVKGSVSLGCKGDNLSDLLSADQIASVQQAMAKLKRVKFKVSAALTKWSLSVVCAGELQP